MGFIRVMNVFVPLSKPGILAPTKTPPNMITARHQMSSQIFQKLLMLPPSPFAAGPYIDPFLFILRK
jgi:hypothetical protein